jgi:hypothetical protein
LSLNLNLTFEFWRASKQAHISIKKMAGGTNVETKKKFIIRITATTVSSTPEMQKHCTSHLRQLPVVAVKIP